MKRLLDKEGVTRSVADSFAQAQAFLEHFDERLSEEQASMLRAYAAIPRLGKLHRLRTLRRHGFWKNTAVRRLGQILYVWVLPGAAGCAGSRRRGAGHPGARPSAHPGGRANGPDRARRGPAGRVGHRRLRQPEPGVDT